jgi:hypothetical protein
MHLIYSGSLLTNPAVSGCDANDDGVPGFRPNTRPRKYTPLNDRLLLIATAEDLEEIRKEWYYGNRELMLQERMHSPRCLYISD